LAIRRFQQSNNPVYGQGQHRDPDDHNGQASDVQSVMVDGHWLMRDGKVLTIDEDDIVQRAEQVGHDVWRRLLKQYPNVPFPVSLPPEPNLS